MRLAANLCVATFAACACVATPALAQNVVDPVAVVQSLLEAPEASVDLGRAKLMLDKLVDPWIDVEQSLAQLDRMAQAVQTMAGSSASSRQKLSALRTFIYESGNWNDHRPFEYDHDDPFGKKISNKLLPTYLATHRGNCVTMPFLFIVLADRLGAPRHRIDGPAPCLR